MTRQDIEALSAQLAETYLARYELDRETIERIVLEHGMRAVLEMIEEICANKAKRIRPLDISESDQWYRVAVAIDKAAILVPLVG